MKTQRSVWRELWWGGVVAIDGVLYRDNNWSTELPSEGETFLLP